MVYNLYEKVFQRIVFTETHSLTVINTGILILSHGLYILAYSPLSNMPKLLLSPILFIYFSQSGHFPASKKIFY